MDKKNEMNLENYWQDVENKTQDAGILKEEFPEGTYTVGITEKSRRDFLKIMGFSFSVIPLASSCKKITSQKVLPYLHKSDQVTPGVANWYATTMNVGGDHTPIIVKTREGRPIKIEGNILSPTTMGGTSGFAQASILSLYDSSRFHGPVKSGQSISWETFDKEVIEQLKSSKKIALILRDIHGPSMLAAVEAFKNYYKNVEVILYNPFGRSSQVKANDLSFGFLDELEYDLETAQLIVGINADFLGTMSQSVELTKQYAKRKDLSLSKQIIKHYQVESLMSLTGSNADKRVVISKDEESYFINNLLYSLQAKIGKTVLHVNQLSFNKQEEVNKLVTELLVYGGKSLVITNSYKTDDLVKVNAINVLLGSFGNTVFLSGKEYNRYENDEAFNQFVSDASKGDYDCVIFSDVNPVYNYFDTSMLQAALSKIKTKVSFTQSPDETSALCDYVGPDHFYLEKWDDFEIAKGVFSFSQPVIQPLFDSRHSMETLLAWSNQNQNYYEFMRSQWNSRLSQKVSGFSWDKAIHDGIVGNKSNTKNNPHFKNPILSSSLNKLTNGLTLVAYQKVSMLKGELANNPWLQELPDPITKVTWDNYFQVSTKLAKSKNISTGDVVSIKVAGKLFTGPALVQPGVEENTIGIAFGYGRKVSGKVGKEVGVNAFEFTQFMNNAFVDFVTVESIDKTNKTYKLALTQTHHSMEGRDIVKETTLSEYIKDNKAGNHSHLKVVSLWNEHKNDGHQWAMMIDLNKCTGCSGCVISCNAENNVPVVGKDEVYNRREMHWMRLDRYYKGDENNPEVVHQPMLCQHCENAPCETVCPVIATAHSSDGLNQQVYNRCVGTRYCANNCPYKVRRFNWFDYAHDDKYENMVLNPDIAVRTRGVMEKCSLCVQRIQEAKLVAKKEGRALKDGEIKLACQQSCSADAIVFGDINDPTSEISKKMIDPRNYKVLEELGVIPRVGYLTKVRNK